MKDTNRTLKFRVGQIVGVNGFPSNIEIIIGRLKNPEFSTFEEAYITLNIKTFLCPTLRMECVINDNIDIDDNIFDTARGYDINQKHLKSIYNETVLQTIKEHENKIKSSSGKELIFEAISEKDFCSLL